MKGRETVDDETRWVFRKSALEKKLLTAEHAWELIGLTREAWDEETRDTQADWRLCEELHEKYRVLATPTLLTQRAARALLQVLEQRRFAGLVSPRQVYFLKLNRLGDEKTTAKEAARLLTKLWRQKESICPARPAAEQKKPDDWLQRFIDGATDVGDDEPTRRFDFSIEDE